MPHLGTNGAVLRDAAGKVRFTVLIGFETAEARWAWSDEIIEALRRDYPEVLPPGTIATGRPPEEHGLPATARPGPPPAWGGSDGP